MIEALSHSLRDPIRYAPPFFLLIIVILILKPTGLFATICASLYVTSFSRIKLPQCSSGHSFQGAWRLRFSARAL